MRSSDCAHQIALGLSQAVGFKQMGVAAWLLMRRDTEG